MKIGLASAIAGIPTKKVITGYGGIERVVSDLAQAFNKAGHETVVAGYLGTDVGDVNIELKDEYALSSTTIDCDVLFDFSHMKYARGKKKYSIPMFTDSIGTNPLFPSRAVKYAFGISEWAPVIPMGIKIPQIIKTYKDKGFCYVGRLSRIKGLDLIAYLIEEAELQIEIAGYLDKFDEAYATNFIDMARSYGIPVKTNVSSHDIYKLLAESCYFIFDPTWQILFGARAVESFGLTAVEALSQNTTILTGNKPSGVREIIGNTGYIMDGLSDWINFIRDPLPIKNAISRVDYYSSDRYAEDLLDVATRDNR